MKTLASIPNLKVLRSLLLLGFALTAWYCRIPLSEAVGKMSDWQAIAVEIRGYGPWGPAVLALLVVAQVFVAFIPGHALVIASGYIFGFKVTILLIATSAIVGSEIAFWLARKYGRPMIYRLAPPASIERWEQLAGNRGPVFYFFTFVLPFLPSDLMCYVAGLGKVSGKGFLLANIAGRLLTTSVMTMIGVYGLRPPPGFWLLLTGGLAGLYMAHSLYNRSFHVFHSRGGFVYACQILVLKACKALFGLPHSILGLAALPPRPKALIANHRNAAESLQAP